MCNSHAPKVMPDYLENHLVKFVNVLRHLGLRVSLAETLDAMRALELVDLMEPGEVRAALQATLVKSTHDKPAFERAFEAFFAPPEEKKAKMYEKKVAREGEAKEIEQASEELTYEPLYTSNDEDLSKRLNLTDEQKLTYSRLPAEVKDKLRKFINEDFRKNPVNSSFNLLESVVRGHLNYWKRQLQDQIDFEPLEGPETGDEEMDHILAEVKAGMKKEQDEEEILFEDMQDIPEKDLPKVNLLIRKLARKLATRISRRFKRSKKKKRLDLRRTIRHNIRFGGALLELKYKTKRVQKPKLVLICDVSASMARYASFVIQFIYGLASVIGSIESFVFAERMERVSPYFEHSTNFEETMAEIMNDCAEWGRGTNLHQALEDFKKGYPPLLNQETFVIIVSDTKTMALDKAAAGLADIRKQVKDILWLNTLPQKEWGNLQSVALFSKSCRMFECYSLAHLEKVLRTNIWG